MAEFTISITIPDDKVQGLIAAYNWRAGGSDGTNPNPPLNAAAIRNQEKQRIVNRMVSIYLAHKHWLDAQDAATDDLGAS